jgi:hypothetical protein
MNLSDKNILNVYKNYEKSNYILNHFTDTQQLGIFLPNQENPFSLKGFDLPVNLVDKNNDYKINELGFRGNLKKNAEVIAVGCSYTFGVGVPETGTWPSILSSEINKDVLNLGVPGTTIKKISELIIRYVSKYDKPKTIFALFPPLFRTTLIEDIQFYSSIKSIDPKKQQEIDKQISFKIGISYDRNTEEMFFQKQKHSPYFKSKELDIQYMENIFSPHQLISDSIDSIKLIQDFCYSHGIEFYWSTWDNASSMLMDLLFKIPNFKLKNYIKFADDKFNNYHTDNGKFPNIFCNLSHNSELIKHPSWDVGSDVVYTYEKIVNSVSAHPGIHFQHHIAELFKGYSTF